MNSPGDPDDPRPRAFNDSVEFIASRSTHEPCPEAAFALHAHGLAEGALECERFRLDEGLDALYEAVLEVCTVDPVVDVDALLGARCVLEVIRGPRRRRLCGIVRRAEKLESWGGRRRARLHVVPALWALTQRTDCRAFQGKTAIEVVEDVLAGAGLEGAYIASQLTRDYPRREYCVQYRETDFAFVSRLLEEEGVAYWFKHDGDAEALVLADSPTFTFCPTLNRKPVPFSPPQSALSHVEVVQRFELRRELRPTSATVRDYDFTRPHAELDLTRAQPRGEPGARPLYDYPGRYTLGDFDDATRAYTSHDGARRAELHAQEAVATERLGAGEANVTGFLPGRVFELIDHEHNDLDRRYLLTRVTHHGHAPEVLTAAGDTAKPSQGLDRYRNEFECVPMEVPWTPRRKTPRPTVLAAQTATVVGPHGEEVWVDLHGRIKVQFHWDRVGRRNEHSSCWVRVAQTWAGAGWGFQFIPRVGMEVLVTFLEGDPDRPVVTGCVYNGVNNTPYTLPEEKTRSTLRTSSTPGGGGYNELRFEDLAGREQVFVHAQRDLDALIENDHTTTVRRDETIVVDRHQHITIGGDQTLHVRGVQTITVDGANGQAGRHGSVTVNGDLTLAATNKILITAPTEIKLDCGGTTLTLQPGLIRLDDGSGWIALVDGLIDVTGGPITVFSREQLDLTGKPVVVKGNTLVEVQADLIKLNS
jgi:type VI secretion system secreted protein VgrG